MIGGRNLPGGPDTARASSSRWTAASSRSQKSRPGFFLRMLELPAEALAGDGRLRGADGSRRHAIASRIEQFDAQPAGRVVFGFGEGWHEHGVQPGDRRVVALDERPCAPSASGLAGSALSLRIRGAIRGGGATSRVTVRAGETVVVERGTSARRSRVNGDDSGRRLLGTGDGVITIETDGALRAGRAPLADAATGASSG